MASVRNKLASAPSGAARPSSQRHDEEELIRFWSAITTYLGYAVLVLFGHVRDFFGKLTGHSRYFDVNSLPPKVSAPRRAHIRTLRILGPRVAARISRCQSRACANPPSHSAKAARQQTGQAGCAV
jgi:hypothetical protein